MPGYRGPEGAIPISALVSQAAAPTGQDVLIDPKTEQAVRLSASASVILTLVTSSAEQSHQHLSQVDDPEKNISRQEDWCGGEGGRGFGREIWEAQQEGWEAYGRRRGIHWLRIVVQTITCLRECSQSNIVLGTIYILAWVIVLTQVLAWILLLNQLLAWVTSLN